MTDNEKTVLEKLCDELRAELSTAQLNLDMWHTRAEVVLNRLLAAQDENAKLRELVECVLVLRHDPVYKWLDTTFAEVFGKSFTEQARELGMEEDE